MNKKLGTICDHKISWVRLKVNKHTPHAMFQTAMIVSETQLIFTLIYRIPKDPYDTPGTSFQLE